ncbi:response regulator [Parasphingopyxis algicola]|uniref:ATP-binding protein n=1 Tax=Parasphingopyxis algicola TaxID=2026624 RepID=UPI0015A3ED2E|nr:ATP-binding protein [Parasphingopyxis algicola]QLC25199.1 response regulator [Parasphingopyxis algicola]
MATDDLPSDIDSMRKALALAERRLARSEAARIEAESILDSKSRSLVAMGDQLKQQEADLLKQVDRDTQMLVSAQKLAQVATLHVDADGRFVGSENLADIVGSRIPITNLQQMIAMIHPLEPAETMAVLMDTLKGGLIDKPSERDVRFLDHFGESRWLRWSITEHVEDYGFGYSAVGSVRNITADRKAEREQRTLRALGERRLKQLRKASFDLEEARKKAVDADRSKSRFLAMMSHDIRTPMNALLATLELLSVSEVDADQREKLELALGSADQLLQLLADIIELARSEGWKIILDESDLDLEAFMRSTVRAWQPLARKKGQTVTLAMDPDLPEAIISDRTRLRQVLDNFISNAIKYTGAGWITVSAERLDGELQISVSDTGEGIPEAEHERLFEELERLDLPEGERPQGTGLGLSICRRIADAMDGTIGVNSKPGEGSQFWMRIPLKTGSKDRVIVREVFDGKGDTATIAGRPLNLLVAEDVEANRIVMASMLDKLNCTYEMASNGLEVLSLLPKGNFDAILMDVSMPQMDGMEATRHIRRNAGGKRILIYGVTAFAARDERLAILDSGMDGLLIKPVSLASLHNLLLQIVQTIEPATVHKPPPENMDNGTDIGTAIRSIDSGKLEEQLLSVPEEQRGTLGDAIQQDLTNWYERFGDAWRQGDDGALSRAHHALKGICRGFGAELLLDTLDRVKAGESDTLDEANAVHADTITAIGAIVDGHRQNDAANSKEQQSEASSG